MHTHIGRGIGKFIEKELFKAENYVKICSPNISYSLSKKLFELLDNQVQIQIITSDIITGNNNSEQANSLAREIKFHTMEICFIVFPILSYSKIN